MEDPLRSESEIKQRYQTTVPKNVREDAGLHVGDELIWEFNKTTGEITVIPKPKNFVDSLWGLGKELWEKDSTDNYVQGERDKWE